MCACVRPLTRGAAAGRAAPPVLVVLYYAHTLGLGPVGVLWNGLLLIAGGHVDVLAALEWSVCSAASPACS